MKDHNLEEIYNTLDGIDEKLNTIKEKIDKVDPKLKQKDIDMIQGLKNQVELALESLAKYLKL